VYNARKHTILAVRFSCDTLNLSTGEGWNTSIPKLINSAIIGLFKLSSDKLKEKLKSL
jgi:hypothetical protein